MKKNNSERFWEVDLLRGIAILLMVSYHFIFDLNYFGLYAVQLHSAPMLLFSYPVSSMFLVLVGISLTLSHNRVKTTLSKQQLRLKYLKRGASVFILGLIITLVTWVYPHEGFVVFGVLHCIGLSILLAYPLIRFRAAALLLGVLFIAVGVVLRLMITVDFPWLVWLGVIPRGFYSLDYFPLLPWFGVVCIGVFLGNTLYQDNKRRFSLKDHSRVILSKGLCFVGRYSLYIYLLHQLIIVGVLYLLGLVEVDLRIA